MKDVYHEGSERAVRRGKVVGRLEVLAKIPSLRTIWSAADGLFPVRITRSFWDRMAAEDFQGPLSKQVLPHPGELEPHAGDLDDPVGEQGLSPVPWVVRKHPDRALLLMTKRCHLYCRYCFRRTFDPTEAEDPTERERHAAMEYLLSSGVREVILSGGDPLAVRDEVLWETLDALRGGGIKVIRIHSRAPVTSPSRITADFAQALSERGPLWMVVHTNHARELNEEVKLALKRLRSAGVVLLNQAVLLQGVNDDADTLVELFEALVEQGVKPYYLHHTDAVTGNAHFRVSPEEGLRLFEEVRQRVSGVALPRYIVDPPDGSGKIEVRDWSDGKP